MSDSEELLQIAGRNLKSSINQPMNDSYRRDIARTQALQSIAASLLVLAEGKNEELVQDWIKVGKDEETDA